MSIKQDPVRTLICCVCDRLCKGRQWPNRDKGYGICPDCVKHELNWCKKVKLTAAETKDYMHKLYGNQGFHYFKEN